MFLTFCLDTHTRFKLCVFLHKEVEVYCPQLGGGLINNLPYVQVGRLFCCTVAVVLLLSTVLPVQLTVTAAATTFTIRQIKS